MHEVQHMIHYIDLKDTVIDNIIAQKYFPSKGSVTKAPSSRKDEQALHVVQHMILTSKASGCRLAHNYFPSTKDCVRLEMTVEMQSLALDT